MKKDYDEGRADGLEDAEDCSLEELRELDSLAHVVSLYRKILDFRLWITLLYASHAKIVICSVVAWRLWCRFTETKECAVEFASHVDSSVDR